MGVFTRRSTAMTACFFNHFLLIGSSSLAYAELYTTFAHLARRFDLVNAGTTSEMMDWTDAFTPRFRGNLKVQLRAC
jgi:hypothetical protein